MEGPLYHCCHHSHHHCLPILTTTPAAVAVDQTGIVKRPDVAHSHKMPRSYYGASPQFPPPRDKDGAPSLRVLEGLEKN